MSITSARFGPVPTTTWVRPRASSQRVQHAITGKSADSERKRGTAAGTPGTYGALSPIPRQQGAPAFPGVRRLFGLSTISHAERAWSRACCTPRARPCGQVKTTSPQHSLVVANKLHDGRQLKWGAKCYPHGFHRPMRIWRALFHSEEFAVWNTGCTSRGR